MLSLVHHLLGGSFIAAGIVLLPLPIPLGLLFLLTGIALLAPYNAATQTVVRNMRTRFPRIDRTMRRWRDQAPGFIRKVIDKTKPRN